MCSRNSILQIHKTTAFFLKANNAKEEENDFSYLVFHLRKESFPLQAKSAAYCI